MSRRARLSPVEEFALEAAQESVHLGVPAAKALDPLTILAIVRVVVEVIVLLRQCGYLTADDASGVLTGPTLRERMVLRLVVNKHFKDRHVARLIRISLQETASRSDAGRFRRIYAQEGEAP